MFKALIPATLLGGGLLISSYCAAKGQQAPEYLNQGWSAAQRKEWYDISQGSRLLWASWLRALEVATSETPFLSAKNMARLGYLPASNASGLPVGFVIDRDDSEPGLNIPSIGLNCAACHTSELKFQGRTIRIDGAPTLANFQGLVEEMLASLKATRNDEAKFVRFATKVLGSGTQNTAGRRAALKKELTERISWYQKLEDYNKPQAPYGYGRLDAQGHILNKVALSVGAGQLKVQPADAPVSYPFIWNAPQFDLVQWNGVAQNFRDGRARVDGNSTDLGALSRNVGEVIGVFASIEIDDNDLAPGYRSSVKVRNLIRLEQLLKLLYSPQWPGAIDQPMKARGKNLFTNRKLKDYAAQQPVERTCSSCHSALAFNDTRTPITSHMQPISEAGTDIWAACNTFLHKSNSGNMAGRSESGLGGVAGGARIGENDFTVKMLKNAIVGTVLYKFDQLADELWGNLKYGLSPGEDGPPSITPLGAEIAAPATFQVLKEARANVCSSTKHPLLRYKARPLNGIWATAPYLHNGSVLTLYDLLLPARDRGNLSLGSTAAGGAPRLRRDSFFVGGREIDEAEVGLRSEPGEGRSEFRVRDAAGREIFGNSNAGHEWGAAQLTDDERWAIVAYLKSL
jgi:hypothetical protein